MYDQLYIHLHGGVIQGVYTKPTKKKPDFIYVIDTDIEGQDDYISVKKGDETIDAAVYTMAFDKLPAKCDMELLVDGYEDEQLLNETESKDLPLLVSKMRTAEGQQRLAQAIKEIK